jgi:alkylation response protein AidB-like acyl-CoA dehydrogenase
MPGLTCRQMKCSGVWPSGTTFITMENVKVPVSHLIGEEGEGFKIIMRNFNHGARARPAPCPAQRSAAAHALDPVCRALVAGGAVSALRARLP